MKKILHAIRSNSLFLRVVSVAVAGVILITLLVSLISIYSLQNAYLQTFSNSNHVVTEHIKSTMDRFYVETTNVMQTVKRSWAFKRYLRMQDMTTVDASYTIYSMRKHLDSALGMRLESDVNVLVVGVNGRTYVSGESTLTHTTDEILQSDFTKRIAGSSSPVIDFFAEGYTSVSKGKNVYMMGQAITHDGDDTPSGYVYVIIPEETMMDFYTSYTSDSGEMLLMQHDGTILSSSHSAEIGTVDEKLLHAVDGTESAELEYRGKKVAVTSSYAESMECYVVNLIDREQALRNTNLLHDIFFVSCVVSFLLIVVMFLMINHSVKPIYRLIHRMSENESGKIDLTSKIEIAGGYETRELARVYNVMLDDIDHYIDQLVTEQSNRRKAEIHALQMQINPHFIYNTLTSIKWLIWQGESEKSIQTIDAFSLILRNTISNQKEMITVKEEAENLRNYIFLLNTRFSDRIHTDIFVAEHCENCCIPKLLVQPFVENAFYHAFHGVESGLIHVFFRKKGENLVVEIIDNGSGMPADASQKKSDSFSGIGIHNVNDRIHLIYGEAYGISIESNLGLGTSITITIPAVENHMPE